ncbi:hypothetical protein M1M25_gp012 [Tenacibaculum phage Gundel_1]|uniref:Uncharacterized protein n=1 Tax=Tenacibaculum phage Gundel_1 TaxID=2745672 RepID=A0A8E4ZMU9_9CAUD|nr:hypothetical protein M1M25_gp012 [Tenacibaculum phage Gundel_1]QQV91442.1 hypothetical protein Gundel1_12 [Tenacibaculum phage Gundel_1]
MNTLQTQLETVAKFAGFTHEKNLDWHDNEMMMKQRIYDAEGGNCFDKLLFSESWDWIIPVVKLCEEVQDSKSGNLLGDITHALLDFDIEKTFEAVVKFIEWYNQQKK